MALHYIESWTLLNDDPKFVSFVLSVVRVLYTFITSSYPKISRNTETYFWAQKHEIFSPTRFDTIENTIKVEKIRNLSN
jgi:hypothetical protein